MCDAKRKHTGVRVNYCNALASGRNGKVSHVWTGKNIGAMPPQLDIKQVGVSPGILAGPLIRLYVTNCVAREYRVRRTCEPALTLEKSATAVNIPYQLLVSLVGRRSKTVSLETNRFYSQLTWFTLNKDCFNPCDRAIHLVLSAILFEWVYIYHLYCFSGWIFNFQEVP